MALMRMIPMLESGDLKVSLAYYRDVLGFDVSGIMPDAVNPYWLALKREGAELMFTTRNDHSPHLNPVMTGVLYFYPEDVEALWEELKDKVTVEWPLQEFSYGMLEFGIRDCHGYLLSFGKAVSKNSQTGEQEHQER
ncbi:MAG: VOC family protein [Bacteroidota bacterium]